MNQSLNNLKHPETAVYRQYADYRHFRTQFCHEMREPIIAFAVELLTLANPAKSSLMAQGPGSAEPNRGRHGFDVGVETLSACRGTDYLVKPAVNHIVANDDNYALAA